jgi:hypothetical protein
MRSCPAFFWVPFRQHFKDYLLAAFDFKSSDVDGYRICRNFIKEREEAWSQCRERRTLNSLGNAPCMRPLSPLVEVFRRVCAAS